mmetsp:Transcript_19884/g.28469  ORF Transcript_19884/g.28469 Transcript_19884/m.28469 type:complete len:250 (+) Transcript_19884:497-1246(+)
MLETSRLEWCESNTSSGSSSKGRVNVATAALRLSMRVQMQRSCRASIARPQSAPSSNAVRLARCTSLNISPGRDPAEAALLSNRLPMASMAVKRHSTESCSTLEKCNRMRRVTARSGCTSAESSTICATLRSTSCEITASLLLVPLVRSEETTVAIGVCWVWRKSSSRMHTPTTSEPLKTRICFSIDAFVRKREIFAISLVDRLSKGILPMRLSNERTSILFHEGCLLEKENSTLPSLLRIRDMLCEAF